MKCGGSWFFQARGLLVAGVTGSFIFADFIDIFLNFRSWKRCHKIISAAMSEAKRDAEFQSASCLEHRQFLGPCVPCHTRSCCDAIVWCHATRGMGERSLLLLSICVAAFLVGAAHSGRGRSFLQCGTRHLCAQTCRFLRLCCF